MGVDDPGQLGRLFAEHVNAKDLEGMLALYEDDATFIGPDGARASGKPAIRERLGGLLAMTPQITATSSQVMIAGEVALMSNRWRMTLNTGESDAAGFDGQSTEVARRQDDGRWLYVIDNPTLAAEAPAGGRAAASSGEPASSRRYDS